MKKIIIFILMAFIVLGYDNIIEFDMNDNVIITTSVYDTNGSACINCVCNLTLHNTTPYESFIYLSVLLDNNSNGVYTKNLSAIKTIEYSKNIYPMTLICTNAAGISSGDDRDGIKVSETVFDYSSGIMAFIGIAVILVIMSFWVNPKFKSIRLIAFFSSFVFMALGLVAGYAVMLQSPAPANLKIIFGSGIAAFLMIILAVIYFYVFERFEDLSNQVFKRNY